MKADTFRITGKIYLVCGIVYLLYQLFITQLEYHQLPAPLNSHRVLINRLSSCSGDECSSLYFLSGIFDVVSMDLRFIQPKEQDDFETVFSRASFSEAAYSLVAPFSEIEFFLSSQTSDKSVNNIGGTYAFDDVTNGSAIIVTSELPGREVWMFSDRSVTATCSGIYSSAVIFGNALNDGSHLFTRNPEGNCQKLEMDAKLSSPLTYCQNHDNFTWHVFVDSTCSSQSIASQSVAGALGTVYCIVVGENRTTADIVCLSAESSLFEDMRDIKDKESDDPPLYLRTYMQIVGGSTAGSILAVVLLLYVAHVVRSPVIKFREGDIVVYRLSTAQRYYLDQKKKGKGPASKRVKSKGFAIVVRAAPPMSTSSRLLSVFSMDKWSWGRRKNTIKKGVLQLQPLKRVIRPTSVEKKEHEKDDLFSSFASHKSDGDTGGSSLRAKSKISLKEAESIELTADLKEKQLSTNWWGIRGGRIVSVFSNATRKKIRLPPPPAGAAVSSTPTESEQPPKNKPKRELGLLTYLDNVSSQQLLAPARPYLRRRKVPTEELVDVEVGKEDASCDNDKKKAPTWLQLLCGSSSNVSRETREVKRSESRGIGWGGEEDMFLLHSSDFFDPEDDTEEDPTEEHGLLQPFLLRISKSKSVVGSKMSEESPGPNNKVVLQEAYSYVLSDVPEKIGGEKLNRIHFREWLYPYAEEERQAEAKRMQKKKLLREQQQKALGQLPGVPEDKSVLPISKQEAGKRGAAGSAEVMSDGAQKTKSFRERSSSRAESLLKQLQDQQSEKQQQPESGPSRRTSGGIRRQHSATPSPTLGAGYKSDMPRVDLRHSSTMPSSGDAREAREARSSKRGQKQPVFTAPRRTQGTIISAPPAALPSINQPRQTVRGASSSRTSRTLKQQFSNMSADADREVQVGPNTLGMVMAGSKLERDDDDEEDNLRVREKKSKGSSRISRTGSSGSGNEQKRTTASVSPRTPRLTVLPPVASSRQTPPRTSVPIDGEQKLVKSDDVNETTEKSHSSPPRRQKSRDSRSPRSGRKKKHADGGADGDLSLQQQPSERPSLQQQPSENSSSEVPATPRSDTDRFPIRESQASTHFQLDLSFMKDE